jgi:ABC-2 type transport system permease protein
VSQALDRDTGPRAAGVHQLWALLAIAQRDLTKLLRDHTRLAVSLAFPVMLIAGLGNVLQSSVGRVTGLDAVTLAFTGVLPATLFQSAAAGMVSIVEDRENDFSRELFVTPVWRLTLVGGKITGESLVALCQGGCIVVFAVLFGVRPGLGEVARLLAPAVACCLLGGAFGLATLAAVPNQRAAMQVFQFLIIPQYVLGGVLVPVHGLPPYLDLLAWAMPLRYGVELTRAAFYTGSAGYHQVVTGGVLLDVTVMAATFAALMVVGTGVFSYRERTR